ncbi:MAG: CBS domain-containing protein [Gammaproteobacteria bacterium]|jgi:predicted transcriptional regulator|nr:CBS domain-containing protein [Gammaproteobacteria bacterium]
MTNFKPLQYFAIAKTTKIDRRTTNRPTDVALEDPATLVMTDFNETQPFSIEPTASIDDTNDKMIACGVRLLFVTDAAGSLLGLVTASDVLGEKPLKYLQEHGGRREDIIAQEIMTPHEQLLALHMNDVQMASVGDIIETMKTFGRQHILVSDSANQDSSGASAETIRGIFSTSQISRQVGFTIELVERANNFAEVEKTLVSAAAV